MREVKVAERLTGLTRTRLYALAGEGRVRFREKPAARTLVDMQERCGEPRSAAAYGTNSSTELHPEEKVGRRPALRWADGFAWKVLL